MKTASDAQQTTPEMTRWQALNQTERARILKKAMPQPRWAPLRDSMARMTAEQMSPIQAEAVVSLMAGVR